MDNGHEAEVIPIASLLAIDRRQGTAHVTREESIAVADRGLEYLALALCLTDDPTLSGLRTVFRSVLAEIVFREDGSAFDL